MERRRSKYFVDENHPALVAARKRGVGQMRLYQIRKQIALGQPLRITDYPPHIQRALDAGRCGQCKRRQRISAYYCAVCLLAKREQARQATGAKPWRPGRGSPPLEERLTLAESRDRARQRRRDWGAKMRREKRCERCGQKLPHRKSAQKKGAR